LALPGIVCLAVVVVASLAAPPGSVVREKRLFFLIAGMVLLALGGLSHGKAAKDLAARGRSYWKTIAFLALAWSALFGLLEASTRLVLMLTGTSGEELRQFNQQWHWAVSQGYFRSYEGEYPYLPYRVRPSEPGSPYSNPKGYRGRDFSWQKPPGTVRVACLGGSTTWEGTYPEALERRLNAHSAGGSTPGPAYEVLNFGAEAWSSAEILVNYVVRGLHADPDYVVFYEAVNDVVAASHPRGIQPEPDYSHWRTRLKPPPSPPWMTIVPLTLDRLAVVRAIRYLAYRRQAVDTWLTAMCKYEFDGNHEFQGTGPFRRNVESLVAVALNRGSTVLLVTQVHSPSWSRKICGNDNGIARTAAMNEVLREIARKHSSAGRVVLVDAAEQAERLGLLDEMHDWCHFSSAGYTRLGELIAEAILKRRTPDGS
jgi:lysophospholipase L1-like esterase